MKALLYAVLLLICLVLGAGTFLLVAGPSDFVRDQLIEAVRLQTGRELAINGGASFTLAPKFGVALSDATLSEPPGMEGDAPFATIASLEVAMPLAALLKRELLIERLVLKGAIIDLRVDAQGRRNWELNGFRPSQRRASGPASPQLRIQLASADGGGLGGLRHVAMAAGPARPVLELADVRIVDGAVRYRDATSGARHEVTALNIGTALAIQGDRLNWSGNAVWRNERVEFEGSLGAIRLALEGQPSPVAVKLSARLGETVLEGMLTGGAAPTFDGKVKASAPSLRAMALWLGTALPAGAGLGPLSLAGTLSAQSQQTVLKDATATLDGMTARGELGVQTQGPRPLLKAAISLDRLDLNAYLGGAVATKSAGSGAIGALIDNMDAGTETPPRPTPVRPTPQVNGWSSAPVDVTALGLVDADFKLDVGQLLYRDLTVDRARLNGSLRSGLLKTVFQDVALYKGRWNGSMDFDAGERSAAPPRLAINGTLDGVDARAFLKAAAGFDRLAGRATMVLKLTGQGLNGQQLAASLAGTASLVCADGAVLGIDIPQLIRAAQRGQFKGIANTPADKTDFSELSGSFALAGGIAQTQDMKLVAPQLRVSGTGTVDVGRQLLDVQLRPKLSAAPGPQASTAEQALAGLDIPVNIKGPWDAPRARVDINNVLKDKEQVKKGVELLGEALKGKSGKDVGNALRGILGR